MTDNSPRRIRFIRAKVDLVAGESCKAEVEVESHGLGRFTGAAQGGISPQDQMRAVARATSDALSDAFHAQAAKVRVIGVHLINTVPHTAVVVSLAASKGALTKTLLGVCDGAHDPATATALAVLNATNRFLGPA